MHCRKGIEDGSEHRLCAQGITARTNTVTNTDTGRDLHSLNLFQLPSVYSGQWFPFLCLCLFFLSNRICSPFCGQIQKLFQRWCSNHRHSICTYGYGCSSFFQLPFLPSWRSLFLTHKPWLSWVQSTGQVFASEWLWADAFIIAFHSKNFLFSSQKRWCLPFRSWTSNTNTIIISLIAVFPWLGKAAPWKWTQTHPPLTQ